MPSALGRFANNLTLGCVCGCCNEFFGSELERFLARDSVEALLRIYFGAKPKAPSTRFLGGRRLRITVTEEGDWRGAQLVAERNSTGTHCVARPLPQVALRKKGEKKWRLFRESDLNEEAVRPYLKESEALVYGTTDDDVRRLQDRLARLGVTFHSWEYERRAGEAAVFVNSACDDIILRTVAKSAFNFLAYTQGASFALERHFDSLRDYVRRGILPRNPPVQVVRVSIRNGGSTLRPKHAVVLNWDTGKNGLLCLVSLFGYLVYQVSLCENYGGVWRPVSTGRIFDLESRTISNLPGLDLAPFDAWAASFWD